MDLHSEAPNSPAKGPKGFGGGGLGWAEPPSPRKAQGWADAHLQGHHAIRHGEQPTLVGAEEGLEASYLPVLGVPQEDRGNKGTCRLCCILWKNEDVALCSFGESLYLQWPRPGLSLGHLPR